MNKKKIKHRHPPTQTLKDESPSVFSNTVLLGMTAVLGGLLGYTGWQYYNDGSDKTPVTVANAPTAVVPATPPASTSTPAAKPGTPAEPAQAQALRGKWLREESEYLLEIKNIAAGGKLDAAYFNPNPINVAKAEATTAEGVLRVFVELRDVNYPGSTYDLRYDPGRDQLVGEYFQATQQQHFEVIFKRVK